jgi:hypothetical protein
MTPDTAQQLILTQLDIIAQSRYPNRPELQAQFKIGFLTAQLARAWHEDSHNYSYFKMTVHHLGFTQADKTTKTTTKR